MVTPALMTKRGLCGWGALPAQALTLHSFWGGRVQASLDDLLAEEQEQRQQLRTYQAASPSLGLCLNSVQFSSEAETGEEEDARRELSQAAGLFCKLNSATALLQSLASVSHSCHAHVRHLPNLEE